MKKTAEKKMAKVILDTRYPDHEDLPATLQALGLEFRPLESYQSPTFFHVTLNSGIILEFKFPSGGYSSRKKMADSISIKAETVYYPKRISGLKRSVAIKDLEFDEGQFRAKLLEVENFQKDQNIRIQEQEEKLKEVGERTQKICETIASFPGTRKEFMGYSSFQISGLAEEEAGSIQPALKGSAFELNLTIKSEETVRKILTILNEENNK